MLADVGGIFSMSSCAVTYQFDPIEAWVVDAETGKPIEGAVVTANWELVKGSLDGPRYYGQLDVKETVTDKNGRFYFEGFSKVDTSWAELRESDPQIIIFKAGYEFQRFINSYVDGGAGIKLIRRTAAMNGKTVKLKKNGVDKTLIRQSHSSLVYSRLSFVTKIMPHTHEVEKCYWQKIPRMLIETRVQEVDMKKIGISTSSIYEDLLVNSAQYAAKTNIDCVAPRALFERDFK